MMSAVSLNGGTELPLSSQPLQSFSLDTGVEATVVTVETDPENERVGLLEETRVSEKNESVGGGGAVGGGGGTIPTNVAVPRTPSKKFLPKTVELDDAERQKRWMIRNPLSSPAESLGSTIAEGARWVWGGSPHSGLLCMVASSLAYSLMGLLAHLFAGSRPIPSFQLVFIRCTLIAILSGAFLRKMGHPLLGSPAVHLLLLARAAVGFLALTAFLYSIQVLPLRDVTVLNFTAPLFTAVFARVLLNERFGAREVAGTLVSFMGLLLVARPPLLFGGHQWGVRPAAWEAVVGAKERRETLLGVVIALLSAALGGASCCLLRSIGKAGEPPMVSVFVFAAFSTPASLICLFVFQRAVLPGPGEVFGMVLVALAAFAAQVLLVRALQLEKAGKAASMQYVKVMASYLLDVALLNESPQVLGLFGALLIGGSAAFIAGGRQIE